MADSAGKSLDNLNTKYDGAFQDKSGRWRAANGRFMNAAEKSDMLGRSFDETGGKAQKTGTSIMDIAKGVGVFKLVDAGIGLVKDSLGGAISRFDTLNNSTRSFENMGFAAEDVDKTIEQLKKSINGLPTPLNTAISNVQLLTSSTDDLGKSEQIFAAMNNGILGFGGTTAQVDNAVIQLSQSFSNGKVDAQTWNSMINAGLGPTLSALGKQMGKTTGELKEGLSDGSISVEEFQDALIDLNKNGGGGLKSLKQIAKDATGGVGTGLANMKTAVVRGMANILSAIDESLKKADLGSIGEIIGEIGSKFEAGLTKVAEMIPPAIGFMGKFYNAIEPFLPLIGTIIGYIVTYQAVMGTARKAIKLYNAVQSTMNAVMAANQIGLLIAAIVILVGVFIYLWNTNEDFRNAVIKIWDDIKKAFSNAVEWIQNAWKGTKKFFSDLWQGIVDGVTGAIDSIKNAWGNMKQWFSNLWSGIKDTSVGLWDNVKSGAKSSSDGVKKMWSGVKTWFSDLWDGIVSTVTEKVTSIAAPFEPLLKFFSQLWENIKTVANSAWEIIKSVIMGPILILIDLITGDFEQMKLDVLMIWENIKTHAINIFNAIKDTIVGYITAIVDTATNLWNLLKETIVNVWNDIKLQAKLIWIDIKYFFINLWIDIKYGAIKMWNDLKYSIIKTWIDVKYEAKVLWIKFKHWFISTINNIVQGAVDGWNNLKNWTIDTFNNIVDGAKQVWERMRQSVRDMVDKVIGIFDDISNINLWEAGKAIMDGFLKGLKATWDNVKDFVGGIGDWIRDNKGPISYDKKLLIPAGNAIMNGLNKGLENSFKSVKNNVKSMAYELSESFNPEISAGNFSMPSLDSLDQAMSRSNSQTIKAESKLVMNDSKQPLHLQFRVGDADFNTFVESISDKQGQVINIQGNF